MVKVFPPLNPSSSSASELVGEKVLAKYGYPVVVVPGSEPPTPLCFSCGSAGINQVHTNPPSSTPFFYGS